MMNPGTVRTAKHGAENTKNKLICESMTTSKFLICNINIKWQMKNMINAQDKRWVYKKYFPVPRLMTSPATMIISICSSEMKRPPTQNCLKNCDFRKTFKIGSNTVTIEHSKMDLSDDERLQQIFCFVSWKGLMLGSLCPVEKLCMIEAIMTSACLLWSYNLGFCHRCLKCHLTTTASMSVKFLVQIRYVSETSVGTIAFCSPHACFFCFSSHRLKLKSLQTKNFDQLKLCP